MKDLVTELARVFGRPRDELLELLKERSAIRQYDGGMTRAEADEAAIDDVRSGTWIFER